MTQPIARDPIYRRRVFDAAPEPALPPDQTKGKRVLHEGCGSSQHWWCIPV